MKSRGGITAAALVIAYAITAAVLMHKEHGGPPHLNFDLPGNESATLYLPKAEGDPFFLITPPPIAQRPPAVVLVHGFAADRVVMSTLARRLAQNGYAVLAIDLHGHGANRNPFSYAIAEDNVLRQDIRAAVNYLRNSQFADPARIFVMGHSMGAGAALDYATQDPNIAGAVMISGGWALWGPNRPRNSLFILAQRDPAFIRDDSIKIAGLLAGTNPPQWNQLYGNFAGGNAVKLAEVHGTNHISIIFSADAAGQIIGWLDGISRIHRTQAPNLKDTRRTAALIAFGLFLLLLAVIGRLTGGFAEIWPPRGAEDMWQGFALLIAAMVIAMPIAGIAPLAGVLSMPVAGDLVSWVFVSGLLMLAILWNWNALEVPAMLVRPRVTLIAAGLAFGLIVAVTMPLTVTQHRMALTPERSCMAVIAALLLLPFFYAFEFVVRRGHGWQPIVFGVIGRVIIVSMIAFAVWVNAMPAVLGLMIGLLVIQFVSYEIFANAAYRASGNLALIAIVESAWLGWLLASLMPITFSF
jgi:dienelactone hydrolase